LASHAIQSDRRRVGNLKCFLWPPYVIGQAIIFLPCGFILLSSSIFFFFPRLISEAAGWMSTIYFDTWCGPSANLECRSKRCCTRLAANAGPRKVAKNRHLGTIPQLCRAISSQLRHVSTIGKNLLSSNISSTCPHNNMVNFGPLAAEIVSLVWGTLVNFNGFRVLAEHSSSVRQPNCGVEQRAPLYSAGRPSRWALAHISSF